MSEWRAEVAPLPIPERVPRGREIEFNRTGLQLTLHWDSQRQKTHVLEYRDLPDGRRGILTIVNWPTPTIRMVWVVWDPSRMSLLYTGRNVRATAEAAPHDGDAAVVATGEMLDCFDGDITHYWPHRGVEVRVCGRWHPGKLHCRFNGPTDDRAVAWVEMSYWEPAWGAMVGFKRFYCWDPAAIRPYDADQPEQA